MTERKHRLHEAGKRLLRAWVTGAARRRRSVIVLAVLLLALCVRQAVTRFAIVTDRDEMLSPELDFRRNHEAYLAAFPALDNELILVLDAPTPEQAEEAAIGLAAELRARPDLFRGVLAPRVDELLLREGFLFLDEDELDELSERLIQVQPFLGRLARDPTLRGFLGLLQDALGQAGAAPPPPELDRFLEEVRLALRAAREGRRHFLSWQGLLSGAAPGEADCRRIVLARPVLDFETLFPVAAATETVRAIARDRGWTSVPQDGGIRLRITGEIALSDEELASVQKGSEAIGALVFVLVALVLGFGVRSLSLVLASLAALVIGLAATAAFALEVVGHLNLVSVAFAALYLGLAVDYAIHFGLRRRELLADGVAPREALATAAEDTGGALFLCALTTAIGFYAFVPTSYAGVSELGLISGTGMFIGFAVTLTLLPALLPDPRGATRALRTGLGERAALLLSRRRRRIVPVFALFFVGALGVATRVRFDFNPLNLRDPDTETVSTFRELLEESPEPPWSMQVLVDGPEEARSAGERLRALDGVGRVVSLLDLVPAHQEAKLERIEELSLFLALEPPAGEPRPFPEEEAWEGLRRLHEALGGGGGGAREALRLELEEVRAADARGEVDRPALLLDLEAGLLATLPRTLARITDALRARGIRAEALPARWRERWVTADGVYRVEVFPRADLDDVDAMRAFADLVRGVYPRATGAPSMIVDSGEAVVRAFRQAFTWALLATALVLVLLLRRLFDVGLVLLPLLFAGAATLATMVLLGIPFNFANVIGLPLLLGIGVDSAIHVVHRARGKDPRHPLATSTSRAIVTSSLTTFCSFLGLSLSPHRGTASMGWILTLGIAWTLIGTLVLLPALLPSPLDGEAGEA